MKVNKVKSESSKFLSPESPLWQKSSSEKVSLVPTPLAMVEKLSPFLAMREGHGSIDNVTMNALHNNEVFAIKLSWPSTHKKDHIEDLNEFVDGVAVLFPLLESNMAFAMGEEGKPTNIWYWKANTENPFDVLAEGFGTSKRSPGSESKLIVKSMYRDGVWSVVFQRPIFVKSGLIKFSPGETTKVAIAVWEGSNNERSGAKSFSGGFIDLEVAE